jgi:hypothetical protein
MGVQLDDPVPSADNETPQIFRGKTMRLFAGAVALLFTLPAFAGTNSAIFFTVPTLDEFGLIGLIVGVGVAAGLVIRRKKK